MASPAVDFADILIPRLWDEETARDETDVVGSDGTVIGDDTDGAEAVINLFWDVEGVIADGWGVFLGKEPTSPDTAITLYDTGGGAPAMMREERQPSVQARVRGDKHDYENGYAKCEEIASTLHGQASVTVNGTRYAGVWQVGDINWIEYDENERPVWTLNFRTVTEPAP